MIKELEYEEPYEVSVGCPTITFDSASESIMLSYSSFVSGLFRPGRIELNFQGWQIEIEGAVLDEVWRLLQMQDLRVVGRSAEKGKRIEGQCEIKRIVATRVEDK